MAGRDFRDQFGRAFSHQLSTLRAAFCPGQSKLLAAAAQLLSDSGYRNFAACRRLGALPDMTTLCAIVTPHIATTSADPEAALLGRWRDHRDQAALAELANRLTEPGWRAARAFAGNQAEDVLQDAFLALTTGAERWRGGAVRSWFVAIVANTARAHRRRRRPAPMPAHLPTPEKPPEPELGERALAAVADLPDHERVPLWLNVVEGLECQDIAAQLGRSPGTVRAQVTRGLLRLRQMMGSATAPAAITFALADSARAIEVPTSMVDTLTNKAAVALPVAPFVVPLMVKIAAVVVLIATGLLGAQLWPQQPTPAPVIASVDPSAPPLPQASTTAARIRVLGEGQFLHAQPVYSGLALHPDGDRFATGQTFGDLIIWDIATARELRRIDVSVSDLTRNVMQSTPNGLIEQLGSTEKGTAVDIKWLDHRRLLAVVMCDFDKHYAGVWDADTGALELKIPLRHVYYETCAVLDGGTTLLAPGEAGSKNRDPFKEPLQTPNISVFDLRTGEQRESFINVAPQETDREWVVESIVPGPDGRIACLSSNSGASGGAALSRDDVVSVWSWPGRQRLAERRITNGAQSVAWTPDGHLVVGGVRQGKGIASLKFAGDLAAEPEVIPGGVMVVAADGSRLQMVNGKTSMVPSDGGQPLALLGWPDAVVKSAQWQHGKWLVATTYANVPIVYDLAHQRVIAPQSGTLVSPARSLAWLPNGRLAVGGDQTLLFTRDLQLERTLKVSMKPHGSGHTHGGTGWGWRDGRLVVLGGGPLQFVDIEHGERSKPLIATGAYYHHVSLSPDGRFILFVMETGPGRLFDVTTRQEIGKIPQESYADVAAVQWLHGRMLIADTGRLRDSETKQSRTGIWSIQPCAKERSFLAPDGSEVKCAQDVVPDPTGTKILVVRNDVPGRTALICRFADGVCETEIPNPGGDAHWTADGTVVCGRLAAVSVTQRRVITAFSGLLPPSSQPSYQAGGGSSNGESWNYGVGIGRVQPSPSGTQVAIVAGDRLLIIDARTGVMFSSTPLGRQMESGCATWAPQESAVAASSAKDPYVLVAELQEPSKNPTTDQALLRDTTKSLADRRAALARLEAAQRSGTADALPAQAGNDAVLAAWLVDARERLKPPEPARGLMPSPSATAAATDF